MQCCNRICSVATEKNLTDAASTPEGDPMPAEEEMIRAVHDYVTAFDKNDPELAVALFAENPRLVELKLVPGGEQFRRQRFDAVVEAGNLDAAFRIV